MQNIIQLRQEKLDEIAKRVDKCEKCGLCKTRNKTVPGEGSVISGIVLHGEAPGKDEDLSGKPFVGRSGQLLTNMLKFIGLERSDVFILNSNKCRPPENRTPTNDELEACKPFLLEQLKVLEPKVIVTLGKTALKSLGLIGETEALGKKRGKDLKWNNIPVICTYHPSYLLRDPSKKEEAKKDLERLRPYIKSFINTDEEVKSVS